MKILGTIVVFFLAVILLSAVLRDKTWSCEFGISVARMETVGGSVSIRDASVTTSGVFLSEWNHAVPFRFETNLRGLGNYHFKYSDNVRKVAVWVDGKQIYDGPPVQNLRVGRGRIGLMIDADGRTSLEATDRCSIRSVVESFR